MKYPRIQRRETRAWWAFFLFSAAAWYALGWATLFLVAQALG